MPLWQPPPPPSSPQKAVHMHEYRFFFFFCISHALNFSQSLHLMSLNEPNLPGLINEIRAQALTGCLLIKQMSIFGIINVHVCRNVIVIWISVYCLLPRGIYSMCEDDFVTSSIMTCLFIWFVSLDTI